MNSKKVKCSFSFLALLFLYSVSTAQKHTLSLSAGYNFPLVNGIINTKDLLAINQNSARFNYGKGFQFGLSYQYEFSRVLSAQLDLTALPGNSARTGGDGAQYYQDNTILDYSRFLLVSPMIRFKAKIGALSPYLAIGPSLGMGRIYNETTNTSGFNSVWEYYGSYALGAKSVAGISFKVKKVNLFGELNCLSMTYTPDYYEQTKLESNGQNLLETLRPDLRKINVANSSVQMLFSSFGLVVGAFVKF